MWAHSFIIKLLRIRNSCYITTCVVCISTQVVFATSKLRERSLLYSSEEHPIVLTLMYYSDAVCFIRFFALPDNVTSVHNRQGVFLRTCTRYV